MLTAHVGEGVSLHSQWLGFAVDSVSSQIIMKLSVRELLKLARWPYFIADLSRLEGDESEMVPWVERSLQLDPEYGPAWLKLGNLYFAAGDLDRARESYERRLEWLPGDPYAEVSLARIELQQGNSSAAMQRLQQLMSSESTLPRPLPARAIAAGTGGY